MFSTEIDPDDEIVDEFEVFSNGEFNDGLYYLNHVTRNNAQNFQPSERISARIKPDNKILEITSAVKTKGPSYRLLAGEKIAADVDGCSGSYYKSGLMDKFVYTSSLIREPKTQQYVVGVVKGNTITLNPIKNSLHMRQSFDYMEKAEKRRAEESKSQSVDDMLDDKSQVFRAVTARIASNDVPVDTNTRDQKEKRFLKENWRELQVVPSNHLRADHERKKLSYDVDHEELLDMQQVARDGISCVQADNYMQLLMPRKHNAENAEAGTNKVTEKNFLENVLKNAKIVRFDDLEEIMLSHKYKGGADLVRSVIKYADIIHGCLVVKSKTLYPGKTRSRIAGIPSDDICDMRNYILSCFQRADYVNRAGLIQVLSHRFPESEINAVLNEVARYKHPYGWRLSYGKDASFITKYLSACERHDTLWKKMIHSVEKNLAISSHGHLIHCKEESDSTPAVQVQVKQEPIEPMLVVKSEPGVEPSQVQVKMEQ